MNWIDWILNVAGLLLWIDWRSGAPTRNPRSILTLASAVRPAERRIGQGLGSLATLASILLVRPCFYYSIGSKLAWTPRIDLLTLSLPWRSDLLDRMYLYSTLSFLLTLGGFYSALLLLSALNRKLPDSEVMQQFVRVQLGWLERIPWPLKVLIPSAVAALAWVAAMPLLTSMELLPPLQNSNAAWGQSAAFALAALLSWKWFLIALFLLHLLNVYIYLGKHPIWSYISLTARRLLAPVAFLTFPKLDLAPVAGLFLVYLLADYAVKPLVLRIFQGFSW